MAAPWPSQWPGLRRLELPPRLHVPLATRPLGGAVIARPIDTVVARGESLVESAEGTAPAMLAPVAGRIVSLGRATLLNGQSVPALEFEPQLPDGQLYEPPDPEEAPHILQERASQATRLNAGGRDLAEWMGRLRDCGIWADRPDSPDLLGQLQYIRNHPADTLVCSLLDDEPTICLNSILVAGAGADLLAGLELLGLMIKAKQVIIVVEAGAPGKWWTPFRKKARKLNFQVVPLLNDYPQSDPTLLMYTLLRRRLKPNALPAVERVLLVDGAAAVSVGRCVLRGEPMLRAPLALRDHVAQQSHFVEVPIGTPLRHVLEQIGATLHDVTLLRGDLLHDNRVPLDAVVAGGDLTIHVTPRVTPHLPDPCIRCSWCVESCPTRIQPAGLLEAAQRGDLDLAAHYGLDACIECGVCAYVCPSRLPLLAGVRKLKALATNQEREGEE